MGIIESRGVNENDSSAIQNEFFRLLNLRRARLEGFPDFEVGTARLIHELQLYPSEFVVRLGEKPFLPWFSRSQ